MFIISVYSSMFNRYRLVFVSVQVKGKASYLYNVAFLVVYDNSVTIYGIHTTIPLYGFN